MSIKVKRSRAQPIRQVLASSSDVSNLLRQSRLIDMAQRHLRAHLPEEMREHILVGGLSNARLTIISGQASWLAWLRFEQSRLLGLLHQLPGFEAVTGFHFKVRPVRPVTAPVRNTRALSKSASDTITQCADDTQDARLKGALERLASHAKRQDPSR